MTTGRTPETNPETARIERLFLIAFIPAFIFVAIAFYVRFTTADDPLWSEFATPLLFALLGLRTMLVPSADDTRKINRWVGALLIVLSAIILVLAIRNSQGF